MTKQSPSRSRSSKKSKAASKSMPAHEPTPDEIAALAFEFYRARGGVGGDELGDWLRAESELRSSQ